MLQTSNEATILCIPSSMKASVQTPVDEETIIQATEKNVINNQESGPVPSAVPQSRQPSINKTSKKRIQAVTGSKSPCASTVLSDTLIDMRSIIEDVSQLLIV